MHTFKNVTLHCRLQVISLFCVSMTGFLLLYSSSHVTFAPSFAMRLATVTPNKTNQDKLIAAISR